MKLQKDSEQFFIDYLINEMNCNTIDELKVFAIKQTKLYNHPKLHETILELLKTSKNPELIIEVLYSLQTKKLSQEGLCSFFECISHTNEDVRAVSASLLKSYTTLSYTKLKKDLTTKKIESKEIQKKKIWLLGQIGILEDIDLLESFRTKDDEELNFQIDDALLSLKRRNTNTWFSKKKEEE